jgi:hypothetical protein
MRLETSSPVASGRQATARAILERVPDDHGRADHPASRQRKVMSLIDTLRGGRAGILISHTPPDVFITDRTSCIAAGRWRCPLQTDTTEVVEHGGAREQPYGGPGRGQRVMSCSAA